MNEKKEDYYKILGVSPSAKLDEITIAYKALARKHHPDKQSIPNEGETKEQRKAREIAHEEIFKKIGEAFEVLKDEEQRRLYDSTRLVGKPETKPYEPQQTPKPQQPPMSPLKETTTQPTVDTERTFSSASETIHQDIIKAYDARYKTNGTYSSGHKAPVVSPEKNTVKLTFKSQQDMMDFAQTLAEKGHAFQIKNSQGKVCAYSDGKQLFQPDGKPYKTGEPLSPPGEGPVQSEQSGPTTKSFK